jgi:hypothetical protein
MGFWDIVLYSLEDILEGTVHDMILYNTNIFILTALST